MKNFQTTRSFFTAIVCVSILLQLLGCTTPMSQENNGDMAEQEIQVVVEETQTSKEQSVSKVEPPIVSEASPRVEKRTIMGSSKSEVDAILTGWDSRKSNRFTASRPIYYYTKDVSIIVDFRENKAVGVSVIDRPGAGVTYISQARFNELVGMIGQSPSSRDVMRDSRGIHEFYIGDTD